MHWHDLVDTGKQPAGGMPAEVVTWATDIYRRTVEQQIGTPLNLWQSPVLS